MTPTITVDTADLNRQIREFVRRTGRAAGQVVKDQTRLFIRDMARGTPPFGKSGESYAEQRRIGRRATLRDIRKVFSPFDVLLRWFQRVAKPARARSLAALVKKGDVYTLQKIIRSWEGTHMARAVVAMQVQRSVHAARRNNRGRVTKDWPKTYIVDERSLRAYVKQEEQRVGKLKSGWSTAAAKFGAALPGWITKHAGPGVAIDATDDLSFPYAIVGNLVDYFGNSMTQGLIDAVIAKRIRAMRIQLEKALEAESKDE